MLTFNFQKKKNLTRAASQVLWESCPSLCSVQCISVLGVPYLQSFVVAVRYCETWAAPLCSISQGMRWTGTRCVGSTDDA